MMRPRFPFQPLRSIAVLLMLGSIHCVSPQSSDSGDGSQGNGVAEEVPALELEWSVSPGDSSLTLRWSVSGRWTNPLIHYRMGMPGLPWDGVESSAGASPVQADTSGEMTLKGLPNDRVVYVALSFDDAAGNTRFSASRFAIPERAKGTRVWIEPGVFTMGSSPGLAGTDEEPAHPVYVTGFWMDRYVATNEEFKKCVAAGVCGPPAREWGYLSYLEWIPDYYTNELYDKFPVAFLEYAEASDYCQWRGMRLPTEAEWERAARGNEVVPGFPWGTLEPDCNLANFTVDGIFCEGGPRPVGSFPGNISPFGVMEMGGNVWEWTSDWYGAEYYSVSSCEDPTGPETGTEKVLRGGAWYYEMDALSVTYRNTWAPTFEFVGNMFGDYRGFGVRCVISDPKVACDSSINLCEIPEDCGSPVSSEGDEEAESTESEGDGGEEATGGSEGAEEFPSDVVDGSEEEGGDEEQDADVIESPEDSEWAFLDGSGGADAEVSNSDGSDEEPDAVDDSSEDAMEPCINPQEVEPPQQFLCFDPIPGVCPSGWTQGCEVKACHCSIGATAEPGNCGEEVMSVVGGWRDYDKNFTPFSPQEEMEVCEGFQGGVHLAAVFKVDAPQMQGEFFYADIHATLKIGDVIVGSYDEENTKLERGADNLFISKLEQVRFEGCLGEAYDGETVLLEMLVRDQDGLWGTGQVEIPMINKVDGPFLDSAFANPC